MASDDEERLSRAMRGPTPWIGVIGTILFIVMMNAAYGQEHRGHPAQDMAIHQKFYQSWMMPDNRSASCCHDEDCSPAESRFEDGRWMARKVGETGEFTPVPPTKVERDRDSPDGRSHLCGRHYDFAKGKLTVFCFIAGGGA